MGKSFTGKKDSLGKNLATEKYLPGNNFTGEKFSHIPKISSLFPDMYFSPVRKPVLTIIAINIILH